MWVPVTVILELEWVVRALYAFSADDFGRVLEHMCGLPNLVLEDRTEVLQALDLSRAGLDFAAALHLTRSGNCARLLTFDGRRFARRAGQLGVRPTVEVPGQGSR